MTAPKRQKPVTWGGVVSFWVQIVVIACIGLIGGGVLIKESLDGRSALADGPSGTFKPTGRDCGKIGCTWVGDFVSRDGTITRADIELRDGERVHRSSPMPTEIADVRLHDGDTRALAYTTDHDWRSRLAGGISLLVLCPTISVFLLRLLRRQQRQSQVRVEYGQRGVSGGS